jgi:hypothetical protein
MEDEMATLVTNGAQLTCPFGAAPSTLTAMGINRVNACNMPAATIMDFAPMQNIMPFGVCNTLSNPQVAAATSAAMGVLTPQPCLPVLMSPWTPGSSTVMIGFFNALNNTCQLTCAWGGVITITNPGQQTVNVS